MFLGCCSKLCGGQEEIQHGPQLEVIIPSSALYEQQGSCGVTITLLCDFNIYVLHFNI